MTYYMLYTREDGVWSPQFGDTDKECVEYERDDMVYAYGMGLLGHLKRDTKIVTFKRVPTERQVQAKCAELNH